MKRNKKENNKTKYTSVQKSTIFVIVMTSFITTFMGSALNLSVPDMSSEFNVSAGAIGWMVTIYMLVSAAFSVPFGRVADLTCRKTVLVSGFAVFTLASFVAIFANSMGMALAGRGLQGFGASMIFATKDAILISEFDISKRGRVLGLSSAATYVGLAAGPVIGGLLNHYLGWRSIFAVTFVIAVVILVIATLKLPKHNCWEDAAAQERNFDIAGSAVFICMILATLYGLTALTSNDFALYLIAAGIIFGVIFVVRELKTPSPIVDVRIFKGNPSYTLSNIAALLNYGATYAISYLLSIYLQVVAGFSSQVAGIILIASPVVMAVLSPYAGKLSDKVSPYKLASLGMAITAAALFVFIFISEEMSLVLIIATLAVSGTGFALFGSPNINAVMSSVDKESFAVASSILATMRNLGHTLSMAIVTIIVAINMGSQTLMEAEPDVLVQTMRTSFIIFTILSVLGIFCSLKRTEIKKVNEKELHI